MNKEPTKKQLESMQAFSKTSQIAGGYGLDAKHLQELRRVVKELNVSNDELHKLIDIMEGNDLFMK